MGADYPTCDPGLYPTKGVNPLTNIKEMYCAPCPLGFYCEGGDKKDNYIACPDGWSGLATGKATKDEACQVCPMGTKCRDGQAIPQTCAPGKFAPEGSSKCFVCNLGWWCPGNTEVPLACKPGHIAPDHGMFECKAC